MKENKSLVSSKRTSLVPTLRSKKNKKDSNNNSLDYVGTNIQDKGNDKYKVSWNKDIDNYNDDMEVLNNYAQNNENKNNISEKITIKNTTTKSIETRTPDGYYTNATQSDESIEEYTRYESSSQPKKNVYDEFIELYPQKCHKEKDTQKLRENSKPKKIPKCEDIYLLDDTNKQNIDRCIEAVKQNGLALKFIEPKFRNKMVEYLAVKENGLAIQYIEDKDKSESVCIEAVKQNGLALQYIERQNERICIEAVKQNGLSVKYVKEQKLDICREAIRENWVAFHYILDKNYDVCVEALKENGLLLEYIKKQDERICTQAIQQNPYAIEFVLEQTDEICRRALYKSGLALKYITKKTPELCILALSRNSLAIKYIPIEILKEGLDLKDYVFISSKKHILVNSIKEVRGLNQINLSTSKDGYLIINALGKSEYPTSFVLQKDGMYIDDDLIMDLASRKHFVALVNE